MLKFGVKLFSRVSNTFVSLVNNNKLPFKPTTGLA